MINAIIKYFSVHFSDFALQGSTAHLVIDLFLLVPVEGVCGVCVVDGWFTASPGLSQTDWTLAGWGCTPVGHEQSWHPG